jgi:Holliday junction resolvasome, endonuclease subunit
MEELMAIASSNIRELQPQTFKRVLGIDPGLQVTGYSVLEKVGQGAKLLEAGIISTKDSGSKLLHVRIASLYDSLMEIIEHLNRSPWQSNNCSRIINTLVLQF